MRNQAEKTAEIDVTPMLDVVFILLIFFVVTSTFERPSAVDVESSSRGSTDATPALAVRVDRAGIRFEERSITPEGLAVRLSSLREDSSAIVIASNPNAPVRLVVSAIDAARRAGFDSQATVLALASND